MPIVVKPAVWPYYLSIKRISLHRTPPRLFNESYNLGHRQLLRRIGPCRMGYPLHHHSAIYIVYPEAQRYLGKLYAQHNPEGLYVGEIVQHQPADGQGLQVKSGSSPRKPLQKGVIGVKRKRDKRHKSAGLVLEPSERKHVVCPLLGRLHVSVQHGGVAPQTETVSLAHNTQPALSRQLVGTQLLPYPG